MTSLTREQLLKRKELLLRKKKLLEQKQVVATQPQDIFLPGAERTKALQQARPSAEEVLQKEVAKPIIQREGAGKVLDIAQAPIKLALTGLKTLNVPRERLESAVAAPLEKLQEISGEPGFRKEELKLTGLGGFAPGTPEELENVKKRLGFAKELGTETLAGLKGERRTQLGDIPRRAGFPEPISAAIGFLTTVKLIDPLLDNFLVGSANKLGRSLSKVKLAKKSQKQFLQKATQLDSSIDDIQKVVGDEFATMLDNFGGSPVDIQDAQNAIANLPPQAINAIKESPDIAFQAQGNLEPTMKNIHQVRRVLSDFVSGKDFAEFTTLKRQRITKAITDLGETIKDVDRKAIAPVYDKYSKWLELKNNARQVTRTKGKVVANKLRRAIGATGEPGQTVLLEKLGNTYKEAGKILKSAKQLNDRLLLKQQTGKVLGTIGRGAAIGAGASIPALFGLRELRRGQ